MNLPTKKHYCEPIPRDVIDKMFENDEYKKILDMTRVERARYIFSMYFSHFEKLLIECKKQGRYDIYKDLLDFTQLHNVESL